MYLGKLLKHPADYRGMAWMVLHSGYDRCVQLVVPPGGGPGRRGLECEPLVQQCVFHFALKFPRN